MQTMTRRWWGPVSGRTWHHQVPWDLAALPTAVEVD